MEGIAALGRIQGDWCLEGNGVCKWVGGAGNSLWIEGVWRQWGCMWHQSGLGFLGTGRG